MTIPAIVLGFLDVLGAWNPTPVFVMAGDVLVSAAGHRLAGRRTQPLLGGGFAIPTRRDLDGPLVVGAALFGIGWDLVGLCPGPALANLARGSADVALFVGGMLVAVIGDRAHARNRT